MLHVDVKCALWRHIAVNWFFEWSKRVLCFQDADRSQIEDQLVHIVVARKRRVLDAAHEILDVRTKLTERRRFIQRRQVGVMLRIVDRHERIQVPDTDMHDMAGLDRVSCTYPTLTDFRDVRGQMVNDRVHVFIVQKKNETSSTNTPQ